MIYEFLIENWQNIIITIVGGLIFFFGSMFFIRYKEKSAEFERYKKAKDIVYDVLESSLINKQPISLLRIKHIINAAEREQSIEIKDSPINLLEDLELRFEVSKHLDTEQQMAYINQIEELISNIESESNVSTIPLSFEDAYASLKQNIENERKDESLDDLNELSIQIKSLYSRSEIPSIYRMIEIYRRNPFLFLIIFLIYIIIFYLVIYFGP